MTIRIYADLGCKKPVNTIEWDGALIIKLVTGKTVKLPNTAEAGQVATATVYLRNDGNHRYCVTNIKHTDDRLKLSIASGWLYPKIPVKLIISYDVPKKVTPADVIKAGKIEINGYYIYEGVI